MCGVDGHTRLYGLVSLREYPAGRCSCTGARVRQHECFSELSEASNNIPGHTHPLSSGQQMWSMGRVVCVHDTLWDENVR